ncbi:hypothetical protein LAZ67_1003317 [Cordylochernes scorpioides]|uniref:Uncharacterized protein n=1 Tax=Cordylochernes scorpioides TaxID=51811 RepID=A0ABY6JYG6_9ARAC|nr:hypothetical protein LAZ67_1003317 [Cordylochernes scorpioides]
MFRSMTHGLAEHHFTSYEEAKNWVNVWIASKDEEFFRHGIRTAQKEHNPRVGGRVDNTLDSEHIMQCIGHCRTDIYTAVVIEAIKEAWPSGSGLDLKSRPGTRQKKRNKVFIGGTHRRKDSATDGLREFFPQSGQVEVLAGVTHLKTKMVFVDGSFSHTCDIYCLGMKADTEEPGLQIQGHFAGGEHLPEQGSHGSATPVSVGQRKRYL